MYHR